MGDIVEVLDDGFVIIVDCLKEFIIMGGFNVLLSEVEGVFEVYFDVVVVVVVGFLCLYGGEDVVVVVVFCEGVVFDVDVLCDFCCICFILYKVFWCIIVVDEFFCLFIGKVLCCQVCDWLFEEC